MIIDNILGTDMAKHNEKVNEIKALGLLKGDELTDQSNKKLMIKGMVHAADISNGSRPFNIAKNWGERIFKEFFE